MAEEQLHSSKIHPISHYADCVAVPESVGHQGGAGNSSRRAACLKTYKFHHGDV
jgi:hypothetical protein